jgi:2-oxoglutarate ferredoxin oxidoreductase subunit delta
MDASAKPKKKKRSYQVYVDDDVCDGCGICVFFCKPDVFVMSSELSRRGFFPAMPARSEACNNCRLCELACPQLAIAIEERGAERGASQSERPDGTREATAGRQGGS